MSARLAFSRQPGQLPASEAAQTASACANVGLHRSARAVSAEPPLHRQLQRHGLRFAATFDAAAVEAVGVETATRAIALE